MVFFEDYTYEPLHFSLNYLFLRLVGFILIFAFKLPFDDWGFDIGNHTWNHPDMRKLNDKEIVEQIKLLDDYLNKAGIRKSVSFAFPGGPFASNAVKALKGKGFLTARTSERRPAIPSKVQEAPMRLPGFPLQIGNDLAFYHAVSNASKDNAAVLVFHGVPDVKHKFVSTPLNKFKKYMKYLYDNNFHVISMRQYYEGCKKINDKKSQENK